MTKTLGLIGLGAMGSAIAERLIKAGYTVVGYDSNQAARVQAETLGVHVVISPEAIYNYTRTIWLMVPAGHPVAATLDVLAPFMQPGDIIIDGGNSDFHDSVLRADSLAQLRVSFLDCGTSGGLAGRELGFCLMLGGDHTAFKKIEQFLQAIAMPNGYRHLGRSGAGHYVKMVHNGIEYALLQAYAEGLQLLKEGRYPELDLAAIADLWLHGSIIRSYILELTQRMLERQLDFSAISGIVEHTGMGSWTVQEAHEKHIPVKLIEEALRIREQSHITGGNFATKLVALLRHEFGGHAYKKLNS